MASSKQAVGGGRRLLGDLPHDCLVCILSHLRPGDVCNLALVSRSFMEASRSDALWKQMLPPGYSDTLAQADGGPLQSSSYRELYTRICNFILLKDGTEAYWLDRKTGGVCYMLSAKALSIVYGSDPRYWEWCILNGSRFLEVAYLKKIVWFKVSGHFNAYLPRGSYTVSFRLQLVGELEYRHHVGKWNYLPVQFWLSTADGQESQSQRYLDGVEVPDKKQLGLKNMTSARVIDDDGWMEYDVGKFSVGTADERVDVRFSMMEIAGGHWKSGLFLDGAVIRPSYIVPHQVHESAND